MKTQAWYRCSLRLMVVGLLLATPMAGYCTAPDECGAAGRSRAEIYGEIEDALHYTKSTTGWST
jgi:hypothetical protein